MGGDLKFSRGHGGLDLVDLGEGSAGRRGDEIAFLGGEGEGGDVGREFGRESAFGWKFDGGVEHHVAGFGGGVDVVSVFRFGILGEEGLEEEEGEKEGFEHE